MTRQSRVCLGLKFDSRLACHRVFGGQWAKSHVGRTEHSSFSAVGEPALGDRGSVNAAQFSGERKQTPKVAIVARIAGQTTIFFSPKKYM